MKIEVKKANRTFSPAAMADIAFLLLIFLILTVTAGEEPDVNLPQFKYSEKTGFEITIALEILKNGEIILNGRPSGIDTLNTDLSAFEKGTIVHIFADRKVSYSTVDRVLGILRDNELYRIILIAENYDNE